MAAFGKPNSTGRSSGKLGGRGRKIMGPPNDIPWVWLSMELLQSDAWRLRSRNCVRFIDFLLIEHMSHAGRENGNLCATYDQLKDYGIPRSKVREAIDEAIFLKLVGCTSQGGRYGHTNMPSRYRLSFYPTRDLVPAINRWKGIKKAQIDARSAKLRASKKAKGEYKKKQFHGTNGVSSLDPTGGPEMGLLSLRESWDWQKTNILKLAC